MAEKKERVYSDDEIKGKLKETGLEEWYLEDGWLRRKYITDGWPTTLMLTNAIGFICEATYHHADLAVTWGKLWVKLKTHSAGGITDKDFAVAKKIEQDVLWRPPPGGPLEGTPNKFVQGKK
jgi:4a-hydroxytetrahydrobiopterin dehydratase